MHKALHLRNDLDRLNASRKRGKRLASIEDYIDETIQRLKEYAKKPKNRLISAASHSNSNIRSQRKTNMLQENKHGKKNNCMDTSSDNQGR